VKETKYINISYKDACVNLTHARKNKRAIEKKDGEKRAKWLEELVQEAAMDKLYSDWETLLKEMIPSACQKSLQQKLSSVMKGEREPLDYIEIPNQKWFHSAKLDELYKFNEGIFGVNGTKPTLPDVLPPWLYSQSTA